MKRTSLLFLISLVFSFICLLYFEPSKAQSPQEPIRLFDLIGTEKTRSTHSIAGVREQDIKVNFSKINFAAAQTLSFTLLDGATYQATRNQPEGFVQFADNELTWRGKILGEKNWSGDVILTIKDQSLSGLIYAPNAVYEIIPQANFQQVLVELDQSRFPPCAGTLPALAPEAAAGNRPARQSALDKLTASGFMERQREFDKLYRSNAPLVDDGSLLDVLVVYTSSVRSALGGTSQTQAFIQQAVAAANTAYQNSIITPRLRLANTLEVNYSEAGTLSAALDWVDNDATVAAARNTAKADLVSIIIENASDGCGLAHLMHSVGPGFASSGFSAVARGCAVGNLSFAHELGHNQGCEHNPENGSPSSSASYPYAFGHYVNGSFRTVMSYVDPCPSGCNRVAYFSNPSITFNGFATGITNQRDNHRVINNTALTVSQFRDSGGGGGQNLPNLSPFRPTGWSDSIVVSTTTGTSTDSTTLRPTDTLYVDWAVINNGSAATAATFYTKLFVDGVERTSWYTDPPLSANFYTYVADYSLGTLSAGTHTIKIVTDSTSVIAESDEGDNQYTKTITVIVGGQPNLTPFQPAGWSDKIVISTVTDTSTDTATLRPTDTLYLDWAAINNGNAATAATFYSKIFVDGIERAAWYTDPPLSANFYAYVADYSLGTLSAGTHTIKLTADSSGVIPESNESDNDYTKTITVIAAPTCYTLTTNVSPSAGGTVTINTLSNCSGAEPNPIKPSAIPRQESRIAATSVASGSAAAANQVSSFSNSVSFLELPPPGRWINSSGAGGLSENFSGTFMASPQVTGEWAALKLKSPAVSPGQVLSALSSTGVQFTDTRIGLAKPGNKVGAALAALGVAGSGSFNPGTVVSLTAAPAAGYSFQSWSGCDSTSGSNCTVTMNASRSVTANFTAVPVPLRIDNVTPKAGRVTGGQAITLSGAFAGLSTVTIGGTPVTWSYTSGTSSIAFNSPAHAVGAVDIVLTPTSGSTLTKSSAFAYLPTVFTDDTLVVGVTTAKVQHITELRQAVDALRAVAGQGAAPWTDPMLLPFASSIKTVHIMELRTYLNSAAAVLGYSTATYTDPSLTSSFQIKRIHIEELRQRIRAIAG